MRTRRALSTVVGAVFAIIALTTTVTYITYSMNTLSQYNQSVFTQSQQQSDVNKEKFQISSVTIPNSKLNITIANTGTIPINFTKLWVQDVSSNNAPGSVHYYVPQNGFVAPGGVLTKIGQDSSNPSIVSTDVYNIKLVTSRGTAQQFTVNSAGTAPLNIQLLALPPSVSSGFKSQLTMIVVNNGSSLLTNVSPSSLPNPTGVATCVAGSVSPSKYSTLPPGSMAVFTWSVTATSSNDGDSCTYTLTTPLQGGYAQTVQATITVNKITFASTNLAANTGVLTIDYTSWKYTLGSGWQLSYNMAHGTTPGFAINITNNDPSRTFYISNKTSLVFNLYKVGTQSSTTGSSYILKNVTSSAAFTTYTCPGSPSYDYCLALSPGHSAYLSIGGNDLGSRATALQAVPNVNGGGPTTAFLLLYGKFDTSPTGTGPFYAQNIPFIAIFLT